ncbi:hypothetical protein BDE40_0293 [Litoreibacter halocynthiae]|uniref:Uncharacterized protein n=1 Tax=Litoreibacter halocynthiae TaxID=1242689 RepID=A0A4R7LNI6_9RHOB|nr:hypothetical protein BDE40_0293 [Litoreibacter halocynthiae]
MLYSEVVRVAAPPKRGVLPDRVLPPHPVRLLAGYVSRDLIGCPAAHAGRGRLAGS